jgi:hypothetical protein
MESFIFDLMESGDYENILFCQEKTLNLKAIIVIHKTMGSVIAISKEQHIPTYRAADVLAEQRIAAIRQVKSLVTRGQFTQPS